MSASRPCLEERSRGRASPRSTSPPTNNTPLLTATLNAPLQSYYSGGAVRVKCPTDLHVTLTKKPKSEPGEPGGSSQAVFYSTLLKQLRQKAGDVIPANQQVLIEWFVAGSFTLYTGSNCTENEEGEEQSSAVPVSSL